MAILISPDQSKQNIKGYHPKLAEKFHSQSAQIADKEFDTTIKFSSCNEVILLSGGSASGKTEFLSTQLIDKDYLIYDSTLSTELGAKIKIGKILKQHKIPIIYSIIPDDLKRAFIAFLNRDRQFSDEHFYRTHSGSRRTLFWVTNNFPDIQVNVIESSYDKQQNLQFERIEFEDKAQLLDFLKSIQKTEDDIIKEINI